MKTKYFFACAILMSLFFSACDKTSGETNQSTVSVFGTGTVLVKPDMIQMNISLSNTAQTTRAAQEEVSKMVRQALEILKGAGIEDKNISTASLTFSSEYEYGGARRILIGQKAEQIISFVIEGVQNNDDKVSGIIDRLIQINGIELNQISFDVKDNTEYFVRSRELAFEKASEKANQYAELSGLKVIKVLNISEEGAQEIFPMMSNRMVNQANYSVQADSASGSTILPMGELEITTRITAVFLLE